MSDAVKKAIFKDFNCICNILIKVNFSNNRIFICDILQCRNTCGVSLQAKMQYKEH